MLTHTCLKYITNNNRVYDCTNVCDVYVISNYILYNVIVYIYNTYIMSIILAATAYYHTWMLPVRDNSVTCREVDDEVIQVNSNVRIPSTFFIQGASSAVVDHARANGMASRRSHIRHYLPRVLWCGFSFTVRIHELNHPKAQRKPFNRFGLANKAWLNSTDPANESALFSL